ncbi:hypothetical protein B0T25DRAFT_282967 [Lasiosphaeria hispida]|uniref:Uncharacterized protein n=1 Tax=Lasiosphaeria hispida TaxID=260671 RepID=A0AAJ0HBP9_9PEZI|nr:hypothetical protein B0T25DRAFT_282967 [Lasiosphaeria hispida]
MLRGRGPALIAASVLGGGIYWQTRGGRNQPRSRVVGNPDSKMPISETLEGLGGSGGKTARKQGELQNDPRDGKIYSHSPTAHSKRNSQKTRPDEDL